MFDAAKLQRLQATRARWLSRERERRIAAAPIFSEVDPAQRELLAASARLVRAEPGDVVIAEGDATTSSYVVVSGAVDVENAAGDLLARLRAGQLVGEVAAVAQTQGYRFDRTATVRAVEPTTLYEIPASALRRLIDAQPALRQRIRMLIAERLSQDQLSAHLRPI
jgi:CRP-like cAMP-binding protein